MDVILDFDRPHPKLRDFQNVPWKAQRPVSVGFRHQELTNVFVVSSGSANLQAQLNGLIADNVLALSISMDDNARGIDFIALAATSLVLVITWDQQRGCRILRDFLQTKTIVLRDMEFVRPLLAPLFNDHPSMVSIESRFPMAHIDIPYEKAVANYVSDIKRPFRKIAPPTAPTGIRPPNSYRVLTTAFHAYAMRVLYERIETKIQKWGQFDTEQDILAEQQEEQSLSSSMAPLQNSSDYSDEMLLFTDHPRTPQESSDVPTRVEYEYDECEETDYYSDLE